VVGEIFFGSLNIGVGYIMRELYHSYLRDDRKAEVYKTDKGWEVDLSSLTNNEYATRKVHDHSETYAENVAENYVDKIFDLEPNDFGYYGYKEKTDNYVKGLDD
jgi:hypothetical protein